MRIFKDKKAQLTIFIIIGLMIIFGSVLLIYIKNKVSQQQSFNDQTGTIPTELVPVKEYIEECMYELGKDAIIRIGETGGYTEMDPSLIKNNPLDPTSGEGIELVQGTGIMVPYWFYLKGDNECQKLIKNQCEFKTDLIPEIYKKSADDLSIENQISAYIYERFEDCINGFAPFEEMSTEITELKSPIFDTTITFREVQVKLKYPINIKKASTQTQMEYFSTDFDVKLDYSYWLAHQVVKQEMNNHYLEQSLANLITIFGGVDLDIPPMNGGYNFKDDAPTGGWSHKNVEKELRNILYPYVSNFKVTNTLSQYKIVPVEDEDTWDFVIGKYNYLIDLDFDYFFPLDVEFIYMPNWPVYLHVTPSEGDKIEPEEGMTEFLEYIGLAMTKFDFKYDVSYPVLIKITDPTAFKGEGYSFYVAMESNLRNNQPLMAKNSDNYFAVLPSQSDSSSNICNKRSKKTGNITVFAFDAITLEPIKGAKVISSFDNTGCSEGVTDEKGSYSGKFQSGIGDLYVKKSNYLSYKSNYVFGINKKDSISVYLYPGRDIEVIPKEVMFKQTTGYNEYYFNNMSNASNKTVLLSLERIPDNISKSDVKKTLSFNDDFKPKDIELFPGIYKVSITYTNKRNYTTLKIRDCTIVQCIDLNETSTPLYISIDVDDSEYYLNIIPETLYASNSTDLYVPLPDVYNEDYLMTIDNPGLINMTGTYKRFYDILKIELK